MRKPIGACLFLVAALLLGGCTAAVSPAVGGAQAAPLLSAPVRIAVASDLHYQPESSQAYAALIRQVAYVDDILEAFFAQVAAEQPDALLLCGDLTNNGRPEEHALLAEKLAAVQAAGVSVLVLPGNHDLDNTTAEAFAGLYTDYGFDAAFAHDESSQSYACELAEGLWVVMLDSNAAPDRPGYEGCLLPETLAWLEELLAAAQRQGVLVLSASHHNLLNPLAEFYPSLQAQNGPEAARLLADYGVPLHFSGHRHAYRTSEAKADDGTLLEITQPMLPDYPNQYGMLAIDPAAGQASHEIRYVDVDGWAQQTGSEDEVLLHFSRHSADWQAQRSGETVGYILTALALEEEQAALVEDFLLRFNESLRDGSFESRRAALLQSEGYALWQRYGSASRYYPWYNALLEGGGRAADTLVVAYGPAA